MPLHNTVNKKNQMAEIMSLHTSVVTIVLYLYVLYENVNFKKLLFLFSW